MDHIKRLHIAFKLLIVAFILWVIQAMYVACTKVIQVNKEVNDSTIHQPRFDPYK